MYIETWKIYGRANFSLLPVKPAIYEHGSTLKQLCLRTCSYWKNSGKSPVLINETLCKLPLWFYKLDMEIRREIRPSSKASHEA